MQLYRHTTVSIMLTESALSVSPIQKSSMLRGIGLCYGIWHSKQNISRVCQPLVANALQNRVLKNRKIQRKTPVLDLHFVKKVKNECVKKWLKHGCFSAIFAKYLITLFYFFTEYHWRTAFEPKAITTTFKLISHSLNICRISKNVISET